MNVWEIAAIGEVVALVPLLAVGVRGRSLDRFAAQQAVALVAASLVMIVAQIDGQSSYTVIALTLVALAWPSALIFARSFERWL